MDPQTLNDPDRFLEPDRDPRHADGLNRRRVFGLDFVDAPSLTPVLEVLLQRDPADDPGSGRILPILVTPNVDILVQLDQSAGREVEVYQRAQFVLPDGMPVVKASRLLGAPLSGRLTGSGLFEKLWPEIEKRAYPVVLLCSSDAVASKLKGTADHVRVVVPEMIDVTDEAAVDRVVDRLLAEAADIKPRLVLFGLGHPKDAVLSARLLERWDEPGRPLCCCLGGSFAFYVKVVPRAPDWVQNAGFEWFYRFLHEPRRLFSRYFVRDVAFIGMVYRGWRETRRRPSV